MGCILPQHHTEDLKLFIKTKLPNIMVVIAPSANLTELAEPLDHVFKCKLNQLHEECMISAATEWMRREDLCKME